jgi:putative PEP-CTERM system TPR-repeat lipoprotein
MKNKKIKFITLTIALAIANLNGCSQELSYDEYMIAAKAQMEQGDTSSAILSLKNAVRQQPKSAISRYELGSLYLSEGDLWSAEKELEKALELGFEELSLLPKVAKVKMLLSKYDEVYTIADNLGAYENEQYVIILTYAGLAAISDNKKDEAEDYISQASMLSEDSLYSKVGSAWLKFSNEEYTEVSKMLENILLQSDTFSEALLLSGHLHQAQFRYEKAIEMYSSYLEQHPRQFQIRLYLINSLLSAKEYDEAERNIVLLNRIYKEHPLVNLYNAQVQYYQKNFSDAKISAEKSINNNSNLYLGQLIAGMSAYRLGELELAYNYLKKVEPLLPVNHEIKKLLAMLQFQLGFIDDAQLSFEEMNATTVNDMSILISASSEFAKKGKNEVAEKLLGKVVKVNPENNELALQYSAMKLANGDDTQLDVLEQLAKNSDELNDAPMILAAHYINEKDYDNAFRVASEWQNTEAGKIKGQLLEGFIFVNKKEIASARIVFNQVLEQDEQSIPALYYLGEFAFNEKFWEKSKAYYKNILSFEPTHKASVARLSYINAQLGKEGETIDYLNDLLVTYPGNQDIIIDLSINLSVTGKIKEAIKLIEKSEVKIKSTRFKRNTAQLYVKDSKLEQAKELYNDLVRVEPTNATFWLEYALVDNKLGNTESALTTINKALNLASSQANLLALKANLLLSLDRNDSAAKIINELLEQYPDNRRVIYLKAQLNLKQGEAGSATEQFSMLYAANPTNLFALNWAQSSVKDGNITKAIEIIERQEKLKPLDVGSQALLAELLLEVNPNKSKQLYLGLNETHPNNITVLNNLAWAYYNLEEFNKALPHAEKAYQLSKSSITIDTYAMSLLSNNKANQAIELINDKSNKDLIDENLKLTLVEAYIALDQLDTAKSVLNTFEQVPENLKVRYNKLAALLN